MKFELMKNEHGAVITHVALALSGIEREDTARLIVSPQMALTQRYVCGNENRQASYASKAAAVSRLGHNL